MERAKSAFGVASDNETRITREQGFHGEILQARIATLGEIEVGLKRLVHASNSHRDLARRVAASLRRTAA